MFVIITARILITIYLITAANGSRDEEQLLADLFDEYNPAARPALKDSDTVNVTFGLSLNQLVNVHEKSQIIVLSVFTRQKWINPILRWDPAKYNGIKQINVDPKMIWRPDIVLYNNADEDKTFGGNLDRLNTRVILKHDGFTKWLSPIILKSKCDIDVKFFPFDTQKCPLKFGSWTYDKNGLNLLSESDEADQEKYSANSAWYLVSAKAKRSENVYICCPGKFPDVTFYITISRRSLFYVCNLIFPMVVIGMLTLLSFLLPAESGERISLAITLLLAMTVFMLVVADIIPATSEVIPLVGIYFLASMAEMVLMIVALCYIMRLYHKGPTDPPMSLWTRRIVLDWLSYAVRIRERKEVTYDKKHSNLTLKNPPYLNNEDISLVDKFKGNRNRSNWHLRKLTTLKYNPPQELKFDNSNRFIRHLDETELVLDKLDVLIDHLQSMDDEDAIKTEWRIVAMTIDRCSLIVFLLLFFLTVLGCFSRSPGYVP